MVDDTTKDYKLNKLKESIAGFENIELVEITSYIEKLIIFYEFQNKVL